MYVARQPIHGNRLGSPLYLATNIGANHWTLILLFLAYLWKIWLYLLKQNREHAGFNHGLPCYVKTMALGCQLRQKPHTTASVFGSLCPSGLVFGIPWQAMINSSPPGQNGRHFTDDIFKCIFMMKSFVFWLQFHWSLFRMVQLMITRYWFR